MRIPNQKRLKRLEKITEKIFEFDIMKECSKLCPRCNKTLRLREKSEETEKSVFSTSLYYCIPCGYYRTGRKKFTDY